MTADRKDAPGPRLDGAYYRAELARLQVELVKQQAWIRHTGARVVVLFEGRDAAGKGGMIQRILAPLNPRFTRTVALPAPTEAEKTQWYFQRYIAHLPAAGHTVLFDRSWYNRAGVEKVMGFVGDADHAEFLDAAPRLERMLVRSGITVLKYWLSISDTEQERRFRRRAADPTKRWKLSPMDIAARDRWQEYSRAAEVMFAHTDIPEAPWWIVDAENKRRARINLITHLLGQVPYRDVIADPPELTPRPGPSPREQVEFTGGAGAHVVPDVTGQEPGTGPSSADWTSGV